MKKIGRTKIERELNKTSVPSKYQKFKTMAQKTKLYVLFKTKRNSSPPSLALILGAIVIDSFACFVVHIITAAACSHDGSRWNDPNLFFKQ